MGRFLYFLIVLFLARIAWNAMAGWLLGQARRQMGARSPGDAKGSSIHGGAMVRDPVCGLHLLPRHAITRVSGGETIYFCSEKCRAEFVEAT